jgi:hypothetical protein
MWHGESTVLRSAAPVILPAVRYESGRWETSGGSTRKITGLTIIGNKQSVCNRY